MPFLYGLCDLISSNECRDKMPEHKLTIYYLIYLVFGIKLLKSSEVNKKHKNYSLYNSSFMLVEFKYNWRPLIGLFPHRHASLTMHTYTYCHTQAVSSPLQRAFEVTGTMLYRYYIL